MRRRRRKRICKRREDVKEGRIALQSWCRKARRGK